MDANEIHAGLQNILDDRLALQNQIALLQDPSLNLHSPTYSIYADQVKPGDAFITARVRRDGFTNYSLSMRWHITLAGITAPYTALNTPGQAGEFVFDYDMEEIVIQLPNPGITGSKALFLEIYNPRTYGSLSWKAAPGLSKALVQAMVPTTIPSLSMFGQSRKWNEQIKRPVPAGWTPTLYDDLLTNFEANDAGLRADGTPCYRSKLAHGRAQYTNSEVGYYTDPILYPATNPYQIIDGKRALVAEKLATPFTITENGQTKAVTHSSPIVSTEMMPRFGYGRFAYKFALPNATRGMWPAGWQLVLPHYRWPDLEQDTVEISFNQANNALVLPYQTNWWDKGDGQSSFQGQYAYVTEYLKPFSWSDMHEFWMDWTPELIRWGVDDYMTFSVPTRLRLSPTQDNKVYMMLQIAIGGNAGSATTGVYPAWMLVDHIAHYAMPM